MKSFALGALFSVGLGAGVMGGTQAAVPAAPDSEVTLTGCVVKGEGGYVLLPLHDRDAAAALPPAGTAGTMDRAETLRVLYWLDDDDEVEDFAGHRVEVRGELDDDIDLGEISVEREDDGLVEVAFKFEGEEIKVRLPNLPATVGTAGGVSDEEKDYEFAVRKVDVKNVRSLASVCQ